MRIALADDAALFREGVAALLVEAGFTVTAQVADARALLRAVSVDRPDVALIDIRMPPTHTVEGLEAAVTIRRAHREVGVLVLSQHVETRHVAELLRTGGSVGYLLKERVADATELVEALRRVAGGGVVLDPAVIALLVDRPREPDPLGRLTAREREVLALIAQGRSNHAISERLVLTTKTVETHVSRIFTKLDLAPVSDDNRRVLAVIAYLQTTGSHNGGR